MRLWYGCAARGSRRRGALRMRDADATPIDALILGGGIAGLWSLRALVGAGYDAALLERDALGAGQTIASQGIIHGGLKYTLAGRLTRAAGAIRDMPEVWRECFAGAREPALPVEAIRSDHCYLWRTQRLSSRAAMLGARKGLRVAPTLIAPEDRPAILARAPGIVARLDEQVVDPAGALEALAAPVRDRLALLAAQNGLRLGARARGAAPVVRARLRDGRAVALAPGMLILAAGRGAEELRAALGLSARRVQRRALHMALVRGALPALFGHCVDRVRTRVTITSAMAGDSGVVWQVGGEIAEAGVRMDEAALVARARDELAACLPDLDLAGCALSTYRVDRVEGRTRAGRRPEGEIILREGAIATALPTKLALAPKLAQRVAELARDIVGEAEGGASAVEALADAPRPNVALPPWETARQWR